ncbi:hypothetical protein BGW38_005665, partial [Lunasporangiospora selenospora]
MGATGIGDHIGAFIAFETGYYGSWHDSSAFKATLQYRKKDNYFSGEEHLLGDAAYKLSPTIMTGYPRIQSQIVNASISNRLHCSSRVKIEHVFGMLKEKMPSLTKLFMRVRSTGNVVAVLGTVSADADAAAGLE